MTDYQTPVYLTDVEAEMLRGLLAADSATEEGHEIHQLWNPIIDQLDRILYYYPEESQSWQK